MLGSSSTEQDMMRLLRTAGIQGVRGGAYTAMACPPKVNKMLVAPVKNC